MVTPVASATTEAAAASGAPATGASPEPAAATPSSPSEEKADPAPSQATRRSPCVPTRQLAETTEAGTDGVRLTIPAGRVAARSPKGPVRVAPTGHACRGVPTLPFPGAASAIPAVREGVPFRAGRVVAGATGVPVLGGRPPVGRRPPKEPLRDVAGTVPKEPRVSPSVEPRLGAPPLQANVVPDIQEVNAVDHLGGPVMGAVPTGPSMVGVGSRVPPPVVVRPGVGRARERPEPGARMGRPRPLPLPIVAPFPRALGRHAGARVKEPSLVATASAKGQPTEVAPKAPAVTPAAA